MKKTNMIVMVLVSLVVLSVAALAQGQNARYLVKSDSKALKGLFNPNHEFKQGFTAELTHGQVKALEKLGISLEKVQQYELVGRPVCGDNICQGNEPSSCPSDCGTTPPDPDPEPRSCYPGSKLPWGVSMVNGGSGGAGVNVAVLDSGVDVSHPDLDVKLCRDMTKRKIRSTCNDDNGHGTHVAGTVAANGGADGLGIIGVAPDANLWMLKVCGAAGYCYGDDMAMGIRHAADEGADIISMSIGGDYEDSLVKSAIDYAISKGVLVIAAAGNDGPADGSIDYPGANADVVAVAAIDSSQHVVSWSSRGINDGDYVIEEREVEFAAPGLNIESTWNNGCYNTISGTSMATPHVAGLAAKLWQGSALATRAYLQENAKLHDLGLPGDDSAAGFGMPVA